MKKNEKDLFENVILTCPITNEKLRIINVEGSEKGHKNLQITAQGPTTAWQYEIAVKEVKPKYN